MPYLNYFRDKDDQAHLTVPFSKSNSSFLRVLDNVRAYAYSSSDFATLRTPAKSSFNFFLAKADEVNLDGLMSYLHLF